MDRATNILPQKGRKRKHSIAQAKVPKKKVRLDVRNEQSMPIEYLTTDGVSEGMVILGCITEVNKAYLKFALPGCLEGTVSSDSILQSKTNLVKDVDVLQSMFQVGQTFACKVLEVKKSGERKKISLSIDPKIVNQDLKHSSLCPNMVVNAAVMSIEDQGYIMDIGIEVPGFINRSNTNLKLKVGQVFQASVTNIDASRRAVPLTICNKPAKLLNTHEHTLSCFQPGTKVDAVIQDSKARGLSLNILGFTGSVCKQHMKDTMKNQIEICGTVLYVHPVTRMIYLTLNKVPSKILWKCKRWDIFVDALVVDVCKDSVFFSLGKNLKGQVMKWQLSDKKIDDINIYSVNSTHSFRALTLHPMDDIIRGTLKKSVLKLNMTNPTDLKVGQIIKATVKKFIQGGMLVKYSPNIQGFVRDIHIIDRFVRKPSSIYKPGTEIKCRILSMDFNISPYSFMLTCRKALMASDLSILSSYNDATPGFVTKGIIVQIKKETMLLSFFNNVQGIVTEFNDDLKNLKESYFIGQIVKCQVVKSNPKKKLVFLSLKIRDPTSEISQLKFGQVTSVTVKSKAKTGFHVKFEDFEGSAFLPQCHLSDIFENVDILYKAFAVNETIKVSVFNLKKEDIIVTRKFSFIQTALNNFHSQHVEDVKVGKILPVVVKFYHLGKMLVDLGNNISGTIPKKLVKDASTDSLERYQPGQSLMAKVIEINDKKEIILSTCLRDVYNRNPNFSLDALQCYLEDDEKITDYRKITEDSLKDIGKLKIGDIASFEVLIISKKEVSGTLKHGVHAVVDINNCDLKVQKGQTYESIVLCVDYDKNYVELSLSSHIIRCVRKTKAEKSQQAKVGQVIKATAVLVKSQYILAHLEGHAIGKFVYLPSKKVLNDEVGRSSLYTIGQSYHVVIKRIFHGKLLGILEKHNKFVQLPVPDLKSTNDNSLTSNQNATDDNSLTSNQNATNEESNSTCKTEFSTKYLDNISLNSTEETMEEKYPIGKIFKAIVTGLKKFQVNIIINNELQGRIHITDLGCSAEGIFPIRQFSKGDIVCVRIIAFNCKKAYNYLPITHCYFKKYADCTLSECSVSSSEKEFNVGESVIGFVKEIGEKALNLWLSPTETAELPFLNIPFPKKGLRRIKKNYNIGQAVKAVIFSKVGYQYTLSKLELQVLRPGLQVTGFVESICPHRGLIIKLAHNYHGKVSISDMLSHTNAIEEITKKYLKRRFVVCEILSVNEATKFCNLSLQISR